MDGSQQKRSSTPFQLCLRGLASSSVHSLGPFRVQSALELLRPTGPVVLTEQRGWSYLRGTQKPISLENNRALQTTRNYDWFNMAP